MTDFEIFALDHARHNHCHGCGGCLLDPSHIVQGYNAWCVGCRDRIKKSLPPGASPPWRGGWEFVYQTPAILFGQDDERDSVVEPLDHEDMP